MDEFDDSKPGVIGAWDSCIASKTDPAITPGRGLDMPMRIKVYAAKHARTGFSTLASKNVSALATSGFDARRADANAPEPV